MVHVDLDLESRREGAQKEGQEEERGGGGGAGLVPIDSSPGPVSVVK